MQEAAAPVSALPARERPSPGWHAEAEWAQIAAAAPQVAAVMRRYLRQLGTFLAPRSVDAADSALRQLARWMVTGAGLTAVGDIGRDDIEDYKVWLAAQPRGGGQTITAETHRQRMRTVRQFFEWIIEWDWPGAPARNPVIAWDIRPTVMAHDLHQPTPLIAVDLTDPHTLGHRPGLKDRRSPGQ